MWQSITLQVFETQRQLHEQLIGAIQQAAADPSSAWWIIALSFLYGLFHAAGPGHGKVIITTYLATHSTLLARGVALASLGALCQGLTAIMLVYGLVFLVGSLVGYTDTAVDWSERLSFTLVFALGLWLVLRGARTVRSRVVTGTDHSHADQADETSEADEANGAHGACCGHTHVPDAQQITQAKEGWGAMALVVASMGLRPCTGAILVLVFASVVGQAWLGFLAVLAMASGTAMAVSTLAVITVLARGQITRLAQRFTSDGRLTQAHGAVLLGFGTMLAWVGGSLLYWSFSTPAHPLQL